MQSIKAVIFDWGGVLIDDPVPALMQYCADALGVSCDDYTKAHLKFADDFQLGKISEEIFFTRICNYLNVPGPAPINRGSLWGDAFEAAYKPKEEMFELAGALRKKGVLIGILSNTEPSAVEFFQRQKYPEVSGFDVLVFSCQQGIKKPDERIFKKTIELLGVRPARAVFVDDKKENITAAEKLGLVGILFDNIENLRYELSKLGIRI